MSNQLRLWRVPERLRPSAGTGLGHEAPDAAHGALEALEDGSADDALWPILELFDFGNRRHRPDVDVRAAVSAWTERPSSRRGSPRAGKLVPRGGGTLAPVMAVLAVWSSIAGSPAGPSCPRQ